MEGDEEGWRKEGLGTAQFQKTAQRPRKRVRKLNTALEIDTVQLCAIFSAHSKTPFTPHVR